MAPDGDVEPDVLLARVDAAVELLAARVSALREQAEQATEEVVTMLFQVTVLEGRISELAARTKEARP